VDHTRPAALSSVNIEVLKTIAKRLPSKTNVDGLSQPLPEAAILKANASTVAME
jgi:hypothetical protein